jgi:hypothetical protein
MRLLIHHPCTTNKHDIPVMYWVAGQEGMPLEADEQLAERFTIQ